MLRTFMGIARKIPSCLVLLALLVPTVTVFAVDRSTIDTVTLDEISALMRDALAYPEHPEKYCAAIAAIDKALVTAPDNARLLRMRISAYCALNDPWSAADSMARLSELKPKQPEVQLQRCLFAESMGASEADSQICYREVAALCESLGQDVTSHDYLLALLLGASPRLATVRDDIKAAAGTPPMIEYLTRFVDTFDRAAYVKRYNSAAISHSCPRTAPKDTGKR